MPRTSAIAMLGLLLAATPLRADEEPFSVKVKVGDKWVAAEGDPLKDKKFGEKVEVMAMGLLKTGIFAIGGETTGTIINIKGVGTWELDGGDNKAVREAFEKLDGRTAVVHGHVYKKRGVEIRQRIILEVKSIRAPK